MSASTYGYTVDRERNYGYGLTDDQCRVLLRALWHYAVSYEPKGIRDMTAGALIDDLVGSTDGGGFGMTRDEWIEIGRATGVPV